MFNEMLLNHMLKPFALGWVGPALSAVAAIGGPFLNKYLGGGSQEGSTGETGFLQYPQYSFTEPRLSAISEFIRKNITALGQGEEPPWLQRYMPRIEEGMRRGLSNTFYGGPGSFGTGVMGESESLAARTGAGSGVATRTGNKQLQNYLEQAKGIGDTIAKYRLQSTQQLIPQLFSGSQGIPQGPSGQMFQTGGVPPQQGGGFGDIMSMLPNLLGNMNFGGSKGTVPNLTPQTDSGFLTRNYGPSSTNFLDTSQYFSTPTA